MPEFLQRTDTNRQQFSISRQLQVAGNCFFLFLGCRNYHTPLAGFLWITEGHRVKCLEVVLNKRKFVKGREGTYTATIYL